MFTFACVASVRRRMQIEQCACATSRVAFPRTLCTSTCASNTRNPIGFHARPSMQNSAPKYTPKYTRNIPYTKIAEIYPKYTYEIYPLQRVSFTKGVFGRSHIYIYSRERQFVGQKRCFCLWPLPRMVPKKFHRIFVTF